LGVGVLVTAGWGRVQSGVHLAQLVYVRWWVHAGGVIFWHVLETGCASVWWWWGGALLDKERRFSAGAEGCFFGWDWRLQFVDHHPLVEGGGEKGGKTRLALGQ
jgi:hypothetical protein